MSQIRTEQQQQLVDMVKEFLGKEIVPQVAELDEKGECPEDFYDSAFEMGLHMLEMSIKRAKERVTFGKPLASRQEIQHMIAESGTHIYALRQMCHDIADRYDSGEDAEMFASMAKLFSIATVKLVSDNMLEILGGIGYFEDCEYGPSERLYRDCRAMWLEEGPPTVQRITAARLLIANGGNTF